MKVKLTKKEIEHCNKLIKELENDELVTCYIVLKNTIKKGYVFKWRHKNE